MTLAKMLGTWAQQYEQGIELGIEQGIKNGLQRQLARRFGPLPTEVVAQIAAASVDELLLWADRVLDAANLDDVFSGLSEGERSSLTDEPPRGGGGIGFAQ